MCVDRRVAGKETCLAFQRRMATFSWKFTVKIFDPQIEIKGRFMPSVCVIFAVRSAKVKSTKIKAQLITKEKCND